MRRVPRHVARARWGIKLAEELDIDAQLDEVATELPEPPPRRGEDDWRAGAVRHAVESG